MVSLLARTFFIFLDPRTFGGAGIAVCFVVASANGVVLHGAYTVGSRVFLAFAGSFAGKSAGEQPECAKSKTDVFHKSRNFKK